MRPIKKCCQHLTGLIRVVIDCLFAHDDDIGFFVVNEFGKDAGYSYLGGRNGKERVRAYGGSVTENVVQALARIVVAEQMLAVRAHGHHLATMTHDEVVLVVGAEKADAALAFTLVLSGALGMLSGKPTGSGKDAAPFTRTPPR